MEKTQKNVNFFGLQNHNKDKSSDTSNSKVSVYLEPPPDLNRKRSQDSISSGQLSVKYPKGMIESTIKIDMRDLE